jgi:hypothetical protein
MKRSFRFLLLFVAVFGLAAAASAEPVLSSPGFYTELVYVTSYNSAGQDIGKIPYTTAGLPDGTTQTTLNLYGGAAASSKFEILIKTYLPSDTDATGFIYYSAFSGGASAFPSPYAKSVSSEPPNFYVPAMGPAGNRSELGLWGIANSYPVWWSNTWISTNNRFFAVMNYGYEAGLSDTGPGDGTYGDLPAYLHVGRDTAYDIGSFRVKTTGAGTFTLTNPTGTHDLACISGNDGSSDLMGMGSGASDTWVAQNFASDSVVFVSQALAPGDANADGAVDIADLSVVLTNYDKTGVSWSQGDFDANGAVDIQDLSKVLSNYDKTFTAGITAVPEPSTLVLTALGFAALWLCARRKRR